jgi:hypothetical protein
MTIVCPGFVQPFARKFQKPKATFGSGDLRRGSVPRETEGRWRDAKYRWLRVFANVSYLYGKNSRNYSRVSC